MKPPPGRGVFIAYGIVPLMEVPVVDENRVEGAWDKVKGKVKEGVGKLTGDEKLQAEGKADQVAGSAKSTVGGVKDAARDALNK